MQIYEGKKLEKYKKENLGINPNWNHRDFVNCVIDYINGTTEKVLAIGGLRGTGKTVGILQAAENSDATYLLAQKNEKESAEDYIDFLKSTDKKIIIIDEYSWIQDREKLDKYLLTSIQNNKRVVITATESIPLEFLNYGTLIHRVNTIHTTMFTYEEYLRFYGKQTNKEVCKDFLLQGGLFKEYAIKNFDSMKSYVDEAIVNNLASYLKDEMTLEKAKTLTYAVLYKAICPYNLSNIPTLNENQTTLPNFLEKMGINSELEPEPSDINRVADIFEQAGIIVKIPNYDRESKLTEQYYIVNQSITSQLIMATYGLEKLDDFMLGNIFESCVVVQLATNLLSEHNIYFINNSSHKNKPDNKETNFIITDNLEEYVWFIECKLTMNDKINNTASDITLLSGVLENEYFSYSEVAGRYVVYNGKPLSKEYEIGTIIFTPIGNIIDYYFLFEENLKSILSIETNVNKDN